MSDGQGGGVTQPQQDGGTFGTTDLFRKVAHDIVGTAGVARGAIDEIARASAASGEAASPMFDLARRSLARLDRLAKRLRLAALAQQGPLSSMAERVALGPAIEQATQEASTLDGRKTVQLDRAPAVDLVLARGDAEMLTIAVAELISNALRFARRRVRIEIVTEGERVAVLVEDDGPGFPDGLAEAMFPILRDRPGQRGAGISLPLIAIIAKEHGGELRLERGSLVGTQERPGARARFELSTTA